MQRVARRPAAGTGAGLPSAAGGALALVRAHTRDGGHRTAEAPPGAETRINWQFAPQGLELNFKAAGPGALEVGFIAVTEAWPAGAKPLPPRPADVMGFDASDATIVGGTQRLTW